MAYAQAQRHYERVAEVWDDVPDAQDRTGADLAEVLKKAALCAISGHEEQRGLQLARQALSHLDPAAEPARAALIEMWIGHGLSHAGLPGSVDAYRRAVDLVGDAVTPERARVLGALAKGLMLLGDFAEAGAVAAEAIEVATAAGSARDAAYSRITRGWIDMATGARDEGRAMLEQGLAEATAIGRIDYILRAHTNLSDGLIHHGLLAEGVTVAQRGVAMARAPGLLRSHGSFLQANMVESLVRLGRVEEALEVSEEAVALAPDGLVGGHALLGRADALRLAGRLEEAGQAFEAAHQQMREVEDPQYVMRIAGVEGEILLGVGNHEGALRCATTALDGLDVVEGLARYEASLAALALDAALRIGAATPDLVERLAAATATAAARGELAPHHADRLRLAALQSQAAGSPAADAWVAAAEAYEALGMGPDQVRSLLGAVDALMAEGDRQGAQERWKVASRLALDLGTTHLAGQAEVLGRRAGFVDAAPQQDPYGLTNRELEVLQLVAEGHTNAQIGEELFITGKTASVHVSNILAKMGVATRGQAAAEAHRAGLVRSPG